MRPRFTKSRIIGATYMALLTMIFSPLVMTHFCAAGSKIAENLFGSILVLIAVILVLFAPLPGSKFLTALLGLGWLAVTAFATSLFFSWEHSESFPWQSEAFLRSLEGEEVAQ